MIARFLARLAAAVSAVGNRTIALGLRLQPPAAGTAGAPWSAVDRADASVPEAEPEPGVAPAARGERILLVDDDPGLRLLLRTTLAADALTVQEAGSAEQAAQMLRVWQPSLVVLDVGLPGKSGLAFCRELKTDGAFGLPRVILLTGADTTPAEAEAARADALLRKPFSPLELIDLIDRLPQLRTDLPPRGDVSDAHQLLVYARDLARLLEQERAHRRQLQQSYLQTVTVLAEALEARDALTGTHARRVQLYAVELTNAVNGRLLDDPSLQYGFLLHDIGKLGVPEAIINKPGPLDDDELELMRRHPLIGYEMLDHITPLAGNGIEVVRSHHERWDGRGYPDALSGDEIPIGARIFAVADALDAMTSERPYRQRLDWHAAVDQILIEQERQFDVDVVAAFFDCRQQLRDIHDELAATAA